MGCLCLQAKLKDILTGHLITELVVNQITGKPDEMSHDARKPVFGVADQV